MKVLWIARIPLIALLALLAGPPASSLPARDLRATRVHEQFEFELRDVKVSHQGGNTLTLKIRYDYRGGLKPSEYPDFTVLAKACEDFLRTYPNDSDFWEIVNLKLTALLLHDFRALTSVTSEMRVAPTERIPFPRASTVSRSH